MTNPPDREAAVFGAALRLPSGERAAYLDEACGGDSALRQRIEELLRASEEAGVFLQNPAADRPGPGGTVRLELTPTEKPGDKIGRYKLLQQIGEGGCGVVYMAEQTEPVHRRVALKVIKLGMDTKQVIARFEAERQAVTLMDHPNIAKVLDAGATDTGRPYFVMELVRGIKITDYCDQNNLSTRERLDLFIQVCQAIQHAHQKGIIHRDIKPSNILVTVNDGVPVPKVIDFGIAKATQGRLTDKTLFTAFEQFIGTPAYMSPEQAVMTSLDIDTRSDIYSLGVLLYELLTGKTPFDANALLQAGLDAMRRTIREVEPPKPSARLSTMLDAERATTASQRQTEPPRLLHLLKGDLDWIVMKCLEKERSRRYETANGLAADIKRHLNTEPVVARPPSKLYEFQKTVRRHKFGFAAAAAIIVVLLAGILVSTWQAVRATHAERDQSRLRQDAVASRNYEAKLRTEAQANEQEAKTEAVKSEQVAQFLKDMLKGVGPSVALGRDTTMLREILNQTAERVATELNGQPVAEAELCYTIGNTYFDIAEYGKAEAMHRRALELRQAAFGRTNTFVADSLCSLADTLAARGHITNAEAMQREALAMRRSLLGPDDPDVATSLNALANVLWHQGKFEEAESLSRQALALRQKIYTNDQPSVAQSMSDLGFVLWLKGDNEDLPEDLKESEKLLRGALDMRKRLFGEFHPSVAETRFNLAEDLGDEGQFAEAEALLRQVLADRKKLLGDQHPLLINTLHVLYSLLWDQGKYSEAEPLCEQELAIRRKRDGSNNRGVAGVLEDLGMLNNRLGRAAEAEPLFRESLEILKRLYGMTNGLAIRSANGLASALIAQGKAAEAEALLREELSVLQEKADDHWEPFWTRNLLGCSLMLQKRYSEAEPLLTSGYLGMRRRDEAILDGKDTTYAFDLDTARKWVSKFYEQTGWADKAVEWRRKLAEVQRSEAERYKNAADGGDIKAADALAWMLATSPYFEVRNGPEAVRYAVQAASRSNRQDAEILDTLAAAYAETGEFDQAISVERQAMALSKEVLASSGFALRLELYKARKPYHQDEEREGKE
jgi:eukaryotic-like serine/threonine-protein kinase